MFAPASKHEFAARIQPMQRQVSNARARSRGSLVVLQCDWPIELWLASLCGLVNAYLCCTRSNERAVCCVLLIGMMQIYATANKSKCIGCSVVK